MKYYKVVENDLITYFGIQYNNIIPSHAEEIDAETYAKFLIKPLDTLDSIYYLSNITESWESRSRTHEEIIQWYIDEVLNGLPLNQIPSEYQEEVKQSLPKSQDQIYLDGLIQEINTI